MSWRAVLALLLAGLPGTGCFAHHYRSKPRIAVVDGDPIVQMAAPGKLPSVTKPRLVPADRHSDPPDAFEKVIGITLGSSPRAYPIGLLDRFEVVNDDVAGLPVAVARCALAGVAVVYDRRVAGHVLSFENSGALWRDTLVLRDRETGTYWSAATGKGLAGPLAAESLHPIPGILTRAVDWDHVFPRSLYLDLEKPTSAPLWMRLYRVTAWQGVSGAKTEDLRYKPKAMLFAVAEGDEALAFTAEEIEERGRVETTLGEKRIAIEWDRALEAPRAFNVGGDAQERAVVPMYWFALDRHFRKVCTLQDIAPPKTRAAQKESNPSHLGWRYSHRRISRIRDLVKGSGDAGDGLGVADVLFDRKRLAVRDDVSGEWERQQILVPGGEEARTGAGRGDREDPPSCQPGQLDDAGLHDARRSLRAVHGQRRVAAGPHVSHDLAQGLPSPARRRAAHDDVTVARKPPGDDLAVAGLRRHCDDPLVAVRLDRQEHSAVPEHKEDRHTPSFELPISLVVEPLHTKRRAMEKKNASDEASEEAGGGHRQP